MPNAILNMDRTILNAVKKGIDDCTDDLHRVAQERAPVDNGDLEKGGTSKVTVSGKQVIGAVSFKAMRNGYNYALQMDKGGYSLGKKSMQKSSRGVRSRFGNSSMSVGSGYLTDSAQKCKKGYTEHTNDTMKSYIRSSGLTVR